MKCISLVIFYALFIFSQQLITCEKENPNNKQSISFNDLNQDSKKDILIPNQGRGQLVRMPNMRESLQSKSNSSNPIKILILSKVKDSAEIK